MSGVPELGGVTMSRRRTMLMNGQEENEMKEWVELLNDSKTVTDNKVVEFDLAKADTHEEYWLFLNIDKHTGLEECNGNCEITLNGAKVGYFVLSYNLSKEQRNATCHILMEPLNLLEITQHMNSLAFNCVQISRQESVGIETGTGKFTLKFPANYTGQVTAKILGR